MSGPKALNIITFPIRGCLRVSLLLERTRKPTALKGKYYEGPRGSPWLGSLMRLMFGKKKKTIEVR
jgi:hypothetical protein